MTDALVAHSSRSFDQWLLSHWRFFAALSAGSSAGGTRRTSARPAQSTVLMMFPAFWQVGTVSQPLRATVLYPNSRLTSPGSCPGHEVLELVQPVVPYALALSSKRSQPVVSLAVRSTAVLFCLQVAAQALTAGWLFVLRKLRSPQT